MWRNWIQIQVIRSNERDQSRGANTRFVIWLYFYYQQPGSNKLTVCYLPSIKQQREHFTIYQVDTNVTNNHDTEKKKRHQKEQTAQNTNSSNKDEVRGTDLVEGRMWRLLLFPSVHFCSELHCNQLCRVCTLLASAEAVTCLLENRTLYKQLSASTYHDIQLASKTLRAMSRRGRFFLPVL